MGVPKIVEKNLKFYIDHKLLYGERMLLKYPTLIFAKKIGVSILPRPSGWPYFFGNIFLIYFWIISYMIQKEFQFQTENGKHIYSGPFCELEHAFSAARGLPAP